MIKFKLPQKNVFLYVFEKNKNFTFFVIKEYEKTKQIIQQINRTTSYILLNFEQKIDLYKFLNHN